VSLRKCTILIFLVLSSRSVTQAAGQVYTYSLGAYEFQGNSTPVAPTVSLTAPVAGVTVSGSGLMVSAAATDSTGVAGVQFKLDGVNFGAEDTSSPYSISWNTTASSNGFHILTAIARNAAGTQATSSAITVTVNNPDTVAPAASLTVPVAGATVSGSGVTVSATATDNIGVAGVQFKLDGASLAAEDTSSPYSITWNTTSVANGSHTLTAVARDAAGNQATSSSITVTVSNKKKKYAIPQGGGQSWSTTATPSQLSMDIGYASLQPSSGSMSPSGVAIFGFRSGGVLVTEAGVPASPEILSGRIYVNVNGPVNTGIAIANPDNQDARISFYFTDMTGNNSNYGSFSLGANLQFSGFLTEPPFNGPEPMEGTFTFTSSVPVGVAALRGFTNERSEFLISTLPVSPVEAAFENSLVIPQFADGGGWTTQVILTNAGDVSLSGSVQFIGPESETIPDVSVNGANDSTFTYVIQPRASYRMVTGNTRSSTQVGSVRITSASGGGSPDALAVLSFKQNAITVTEASVIAAPAGTSFQVYAESSGAVGQIGSIQTGVAIANPWSFPVNVNLEIAALDGSIPSQPVSITIPAGGQIARFINELFPDLPSAFQGICRVAGTSSIHLVSLRGRYNERREFLMSTTPPWDESTVPSSLEMVFPHIVGGGGYSTQFVVFGTAPGQVSAGNLSLRSKDGVPLTVD
jgi:hypothetical protein